MIMMTTTTISLALLGLSQLGTCHMIMKSPTPFAASKHANDNGPLKPDGSDYPCKFGYDTEGASNTMPLGSTQQLAFTGGATHGGGSCQVSLTYDKAPTKDSKFKVIHSIVGGCPARNTNGNIGSTATTEDPDKYEFKIPDNLPPGDAVLSWTWFNKVGNREMYMNCAPVKLTGSSQKRHESNETELMKRDMSAFEALPDMFVANIGNGCTTKDSSDLQFDNPGSSVETNSRAALAGPVGSCASGSKKASSPDASTPKPSSSSNSGNADAGGSKPKPAKSSPEGGAFFDSKPKPNAASEYDQPTNDAPAAAAEETPKSNESPKSQSENGTSESIVSVSAGPTTPGSSCSPDGTWNCLDGKSYQQCGSGVWSAVMPLAAGTSCKSGMGASVHIEANHKRSARFPRSHLRRHLNPLKNTM